MQDELIKEMRQDLKQLLTSQTDMKLELKLYNAYLNEHMRRTELMETRVGAMEKMAIKITAIYGFIMAVSAIAVALKKLQVF